MPTLRLALLVLTLASAASAQIRPETDSGPGAEGIEPAGLSALGHRVAFTAMSDGPPAVYLFDPGTKRTTAVPIEGAEWLGGAWALGGHLYATAMGENGGALVSIDPATGRSTGLLALSADAGVEGLASDGATTYATMYDYGKSWAVVRAGADGRAEAVGPQPVAENTGMISEPVIVGGDVYVSVGAQDDTYALWRLRDGRVGRADVLPGVRPEEYLTLTAADGVLWVAASDPETRATRLWWLPAGAARATPVPAFEAFDVSGYEFQAVGEHVVYTQYDEGTGRLRAYVADAGGTRRGVAGFDAGDPTTAPGNQARVLDGVLYLWGYDGGTSPTGLYRIDPAAATAQRVARLDGGPDAFVRDRHGFALLDGRLYVSGDDGEHGAELYSVPLDPAPRR